MHIYHVIYTRDNNQRVNVHIAKYNEEKGFWWTRFRKDFKVQCDINRGIYISFIKYFTYELINFLLI